MKLLEFNVELGTGVCKDSLPLLPPAFHFGGMAV